MNDKRPQQSYHVNQPYPPVQAMCQNPAYARAMLDNQSGSDSEMSAVSLYFYNHLMAFEAQDLAVAFHKISIVEMQHLEIFGALAFQLGENPRLWTQGARRKVYWTPAYNRYSLQIEKMLANSIESEKQAIAKYRSQLGWIKDSNVLENLKRIILDEELHVEILSNLQRSRS